MSTYVQVESLTAARKSAMSGSEPSDAIRVVNALLTQIDQIKRYPNVIILTTSNVTGAIDLAFVDRYPIAAILRFYLDYRICMHCSFYTELISSNILVYHLLLLYSKSTTRVSVNLQE